MWPQFALGLLAASAVLAQTAPLQISTASLPNGMVSEAYSSKLVASGGSAPYTWGGNGSFPGLAFDALSGVLSGSPKTVGTYSIALHVSDSKGATAQKSYQFTVVAAFAFSSGVLGGKVGVAYKSSPTVSGGTTPYSFSISSGALPPGLSLNTATAVMSGTPSAEGTFQFTETARDNAGRSIGLPFTMTIAPAAYPLADGYVGESYRAALVEMLADSVPYPVVSPLPPGTKIEVTSNTKAGYHSLFLTGTPDKDGIYALELLFIHGLYGTDALASRINYTVKVLPKLPLQFASPLPQPRVAQPYNAVLLSGGRPPFTLTIVSGTVPDGLAISSQTPSLALAGTPKFARDYAFTVAATDGGSQASQGFRLSVLPYKIGSDNIMNAAAYTAGPVSPGEIIAIFGADLGPEALAKMAPDAQGMFGSTLSGTKVLFNGTPSPLLYVSYGQVGAIVPYGVAGAKSVKLEVEHNGVRGDALDLPVSDVALGVFSANGTGTGPGAILNQNYSLNSQSNPAERGSVVMIYATGLGVLSTPVVDGSIVKDIAAHPAPVTVLIGGSNAEVLYAGSAPGNVAGLSQINAVIPADAPMDSTLPIVLLVGERKSQAGVTVSVK